MDPDILKIPQPLTSAESRDLLHEKIGTHANFEHGFSEISMVSHS
jgi:hypothetical protein